MRNLVLPKPLPPKKQHYLALNFRHSTLSNKILLFFKKGENKLMNFVNHFVDELMVPWIIFLYLIANWGSYIYTAFMAFFCFLLCVVFNHFKIQDKLFPTKPWRGVFELFYHFWILTLFIAYFISSQKIESVKAQ